jgi:hypothetical protein
VVHHNLKQFSTFPGKGFGINTILQGEYNVQDFTELNGEIIIKSICENHKNEVIN